MSYCAVYYFVADSVRVWLDNAWGSSILAGDVPCKYILPRQSEFDQRILGNAGIWPMGCAHQVSLTRECSRVPCYICKYIKY